MDAQEGKAFAAHVFFSEGCTAESPASASHDSVGHFPTVLFPAEDHC